MTGPAARRCKNLVYVLHATHLQIPQDHSMTDWWIAPQQVAMCFSRTESRLCGVPPLHCFTHQHLLIAKELIPGQLWCPCE